MRLFGQKHSLRLGAFQNHLVRDKRDKFPVRGLIVCCVNLYAENAVDVFDFAAIPGDFDCVSYRSLDLAAARVELIGNRRIQFFGDVVDDIGRIDRHFDCFP